MSTLDEVELRLFQLFLFELNGFVVGCGFFAFGVG
jgi:hypothetical protein